MSYCNDHFQIFVNKTPLAGPSPSSFLAPADATSNIKRFTFSAAGVYQSGLFDNNNLNSTLSLESAQGSTNAPENLYQSHLGSSNRYSVSYQGNVSGSDSYNPYEDDQISTPTYAEDYQEKAYGSSFNNNSKKIRKEMLGSNYRTWANKKAFQEEDKLKTKRNPWQPEEDDQVLDLVAKYGQSWALIASLMQGRSGKQIRDRYLNKLRPDINKGEWTQREDEIVMTLCSKIGHKWSRIATQLPGRTEGQVKNRFYSHIKKRMPKWAANVEFTEQNDEEEVFQEDNERIHQGRAEPFSVKEETMSFGLNEKLKTSKKPMNLNFANGGKGFNSLNIKLNSYSQNETSPGRRFGMNVKNLLSRDPTDVISYTGMSAIAVPAKSAVIDEAKSPYSQQSAVPLSSTRASSMAHEKEFEENFDAAVQGKSKMITFSLFNGNLLQGQNTANKQVNQIDFSNGNGKINLKIF